MTEYFREHLSETFQDLERINATPNPYGGAYSWIVRIQCVEAVMDKLGIGQRQGEEHSTTISDSGIPPFQISCEDVKKCFGFNVATFDSSRSRVRKLRKVWNGLADNQELWENDPGAVRESRVFRALQESFSFQDGMLPSRNHDGLLRNAGQRLAVNMAMAPILKDCKVISEKYHIDLD